PLVFFILSLLQLPLPPQPSLFPYTTLFRSQEVSDTLAGSFVVAIVSDLPGSDGPSACPWMLSIAFVSFPKGFFPDPNFGNIPGLDRKSTRLNSSHGSISYAVFCLKKKKNKN